jgi:predicted ABC-type sugar transport system permease subunit
MYMQSCLLLFAFVCYSYVMPLLFLSQAPENVVVVVGVVLHDFTTVAHIYTVGSRPTAAIKVRRGLYCVHRARTASLFQ